MTFKPQQKIALIYVIAAALWIYVSDAIVATTIDGAHQVLVQNIKGWTYVLLTGVMLYLLVKRDIDAIERANEAVIQSYEDALRGWIQVMDLRHKETRNHTERVTKVAVAFARLAGIEGEQLKILERGAMLHDIGKVGIPDAILIKPGALTADEFAVMQQHPVIAYELLRKIDFLRPCIDIPYYHHERWDGTGYPRGLRGTEIPFAARLFSIVDVWDALTFSRVYKDAWPEERVLDMIKSESGKQFDPNAVELFLFHYPHLKSIAESATGEGD